MNKIWSDIKSNPLILKNELSYFKKKYHLRFLNNIKISKLLIKTILNNYKPSNSKMILNGKLSVFFAKKIVNKKQSLSFGVIQEKLEQYGRIYG